MAAGESHEPADDLCAEPASLEAGVNGYVGDLGAVKAVRQHPPGTGEDFAGVGEAGEHVLPNTVARAAGRLSPRGAIRYRLESSSRFTAPTSWTQE